MDGGCAADRRRMRDGCAPAAWRRRDGSATDARWTDDQCIRRASVSLRASSVRRAPAVHPSQGRNKPYFGLMTDGRRARDGQTTLARRMCDRRATDALWSSVHRASVALPWHLRCAAAAHPSRNRRLSAAQTPSIRHKAEIDLISAL